MSYFGLFGCVLFSKEKQHIKKAKFHGNGAKTLRQDLERDAK